MALHSDLPPPYTSLHESTVDLTDPDSAVGEDDGDHLASSFEEKDIRIGFIQKVLTLTWLQQMLALGIIVAVLSNEYSFRRTLDDNYANSIVISTLAFLLVQGMLVYCSDSTRWAAPYKYAFLVAYPASLAVFLSVVARGSALEIVFIAWIYFCVTVLVLLLYSILALQTRVEFTTRAGLLVAGGLVAVTACTIPFAAYRPFCTLYALVVAFALCAYILVDIQAMMAKEHRFALLPSDFVKAALIIHIDYCYIITKMFNSMRANEVS